MRRVLLLGLTTLLMVAARYADSGRLRGTVTDASGAPVAGASVTVRGASLTALTDTRGNYVIAGVPAGVHTVQVTRIGYGEAVQSVNVADGQEVTADFTLSDAAVALEGLTVTGAARRAQKITEAPATIDVITERTIAEYPSNIGELAARQKGVDYVRAGVLGTGLNIRGFNSAFNPKNLQMDDGRLSTLISTGLPFGALTTVVKDDIERVEIVLGPSAALYGPNAHNGLVNTVTKDPRSYPGTTFALGAGSQSVVNGRLRHAQVVNDRFAFKVTAEYLQGKEFDYVDTVYVGTRALNELELDRDFDSLRGEAAAYLTLAPGSDLILSYGGSQNNNLGVTNAGRNQIQDWKLHVLQARYVSPRLFAQVYRTWSKTDSTYAINQRTQNWFSFVNAGFSDDVARERSYREQWAGTSPTAGVALQRSALFIDDSKRLNAEVQYNNSFAGFELTLGGQYQRDDADSHNTYLLDDDGPITLGQYGIYGQVERPLGSGFGLIFAARGDDHELYGFNFIPKAGLTYTRGAGTWRVTYGKGIAAPTILNLSGDLFGGLVLGNGEGFTKSDGSTIEPLEVETIQSIEAGYKGILGSSVYLDVNGYYNQSKNFLSPLTNIAPTGLGGGPIVTQRGTNPIQEYQSGIVRPGDFVLTYLNFGEVDTYGFDIGLNVYLTSGFWLGSNYSFFDYSLDEDDPKNDGDGNGRVTETDLPINTPKHKMTFSANASQDRWFGSVFTRWVQEYDFFSGINVAAETNEDLTVGGSPVVEGQRVGRDFNEGPLGGFVNVDVTAGFRVTPRVTLAGHVTNLFDSDVREFVASPPISRLFSTEVRVSF